jgi:hypothetical protein
MDGLGRSVGDGISGLVGGVIAAFTTAVAGAGHALGSALSGGALPVIAVALVLLVLLLVLRR